jgi:Family of unknown function (DUF6510)
MHALDGNAVAGDLLEHFGTEMTTVTGRCGHCGGASLVAELRVYLKAPGAVIRCPFCGQVVMVIVTAAGVPRVRLAGLELPG